MERGRPRFLAVLIALLAISLVQPALAQGQGWPDQWASQDVGNVGAAGSSERVGTRLVVRGAGADVWDTADEFHFAHTTISGDFVLTAYVAHVDDVDRWTKAGLMIRDGLAANARHAFLFATPRAERGVAFQRRPVTGGTSVHTSGPATAPPVWLRLTRQGDFVAAAVRAVETDEWTQIAEQHFSGLPRDVQVGFAVSSHVDGYAAEVAAIGNEGLVGLAAIFPGRTGCYQSLVQLPGDAYRLRAEVFQSEFERAGSFRLAVMIHLQAVLDQIVQSGACNRFHTTRQRLCRWLLMSQDRTQSDTFSVTQEFIALTLGADRKRVSTAAATLQDAGMIRQRHGKIRILNRRGLEACACECYHVVTGRPVDKQLSPAGQQPAYQRRPAQM